MPCFVLEKDFLMSIPSLQPASAPGVRFGGSVADLHKFVHPVGARPDPFYEDLYVSRALKGKPGQSLEAAIVKRLRNARSHENILLYGISGSGKSMVMGRLERELKAQGLPVHVTNGGGGWDTAEAFLESHKDKSKAVILANEVGIYTTFNAQKLLDLKTRYPNLVIVGEVESSYLAPPDPEDPEPGIHDLFPNKASQRFEVLPMSTPETVRMMSSVLDYCGFTGFTDTVKEAILKRWPEPSMEMLRHKLLDLTETIPKIRAEGITDNRLEPEAIPESVFKEIFDLKA